MKLYIDIETRSPCNLKTSGQYVYAAHPLTEILMMAWAIGDAPIRVWFCLSQPMPAELRAALTDTTVTIVAHNVSFERVVMAGVWGLDIPLERWGCTASRAARYGLPRTLDGAAAALGLEVQKDKTGHTLMLAMCKPRAIRAGSPTNPADPGGRPIYRDAPADIARLAVYCAKDVEVERVIDGILPPLTPPELAMWRMTERVNDRGVCVDTALLLTLTLLVDDAERDVNARISAATCGAIPKVSDHGALTRWLLARGIDDADDTGVGKQAVAAMLDRADLDPLIRNVLVMRQQGGGSATKKYRAITQRLSNDGRIRGVLVYCGAAGTGRWSSRGAQLQNLIREDERFNALACIRDILAKATIPELEELYGPILVVCAKLLRPLFTAAPGKVLTRGDYSQIEARILAWLAGAAWKVQAFRDYDAGTGPDLYKIAGAKIYRVEVSEVSKPQRQIGKVGELALGYGGGKGAFLTMAKGYGVKVTEDVAEEIKLAWRAGNPEVVQLWADLEWAAVRCMQVAPGQVFPVGNLGVTFRRTKLALAMRLPSGTSLLYWTPRLAMRPTPWGEDRLSVICRTEDAKTKQWVERALYGGLICENLTQATARDIMADAMVRLEAAGLDPVLTVHDEGIAEAGHNSAAEVERILLQAPAWAVGLPIAADCSTAFRYLKGK